MKRNLLSIVIIFFVASSYGQWQGNYSLNFDDGYYLYHLKIDHNSNPDNIWQIGVPQKTIFTSAFSLPNAIVTDRTNPYPTNDTSVFIIKNTANGGFTAPHTVLIEGRYYVNSDTLTDYGKFEFSPNNGTTWIDLINNTTYSSYIMWGYPKPTLTGNSNGWREFYVNIAQLGPVFNVHSGDTVLYRFTFISDNIQTNKDGLMFDSFYFNDYVEGVNEIRNDNLISLYPNPAKDILKIYCVESIENKIIQIYNNNGQTVYFNPDFKGETIDTKTLKNGIYFLKYANNKYFSIKKFVVSH